MSDIVLKAENISKQYRLGQLGTGTLSHDLNRFWARLRGKEDPYLKVGDINDRTAVGNSDYVWSLKDISFDVRQGEVLGIIGKNGAGKSTLLKILSQVTTPTTGQVKVKGRIAALLEVGTGFHPDLSGRENVFLNGAILGMTKAEIKSKLDEIVDFSGVAKYLDTPVKRYSSGMMVRLAFAVAAHLEPEILIVDEVLAVGDAEFQKKCLGKMKDVSGQGRTVLFVSHNLPSILTLCNNSILLDKGRISATGRTQDIINIYASNDFANSAERSWDLDSSPGNSYVKLIKATMIPELKDLSEAVTVNTPLLFQFEFINYQDDAIISIAIDIVTLSGVDMFTSAPAALKPLKKGVYVTTCRVPGQLLNDDTYSVSIQIIKDGIEMIHREADALVFKINDTIRDSGYTGKWPGAIRPRLDWTMDLTEKNF